VQAATSSPLGLKFGAQTSDQGFPRPRLLAGFGWLQAIAPLGKPARLWPEVVKRNAGQIPLRCGLRCRMCRACGCQIRAAWPRDAGGRFHWFQTAAASRTAATGGQLGADPSLPGSPKPSSPPHLNVFARRSKSHPRDRPGGSRVEWAKNQPPPLNTGPHKPPAHRGDFAPDLARHTVAHWSACRQTPVGHKRWPAEAGIELKYGVDWSRPSGQESKMAVDCPK